MDNYGFGLTVLKEWNMLRVQDKLIMNGCAVKRVCLRCEQSDESVLQSIV